VSDLRALLRPLLARRLSPTERRALAAELRQLAAEQEQLAGALHRDAARPAPTRVAGSSRRTGRPGAMYCYLEQRDARDRSESALSLRIGRGIYDAYQALRPDPGAELRLAPQVVGRTLRLVEDAGGYLVTVNAGGCRINVSGARDHLGALPLNTRWPARAVRGAIVADLDAGA
jgi:hypothetical protein